MTDDLVTWLRAQLDDDERVAQNAHGVNLRRWHLAGSSIQARSAGGSETVVAPTIWPQEGEHIVRHDPARVVAEVDAKRRILELYDVSTSRELKPDAWELMKHAVRALALPYADRPGYRDEWKP